MENRFRTRFAAALAVGLALLALAAVRSRALTDVYLDLKSQGARRVVLAVPRFATAQDTPAYKELAEQVRTTLFRDLERSGIFDLVDISAFYSSAGAEEGEINFNQWFLVGMQSLTVGSLRFDGDRVEFRAWLYDVPMGQLIVGKSYRGPANEVDRIVHRWADEIVFRYTGRKGIAQTRIVAVVKTAESKELALMDYDGGHLTMITNNKSLNLNPQFSPTRPIIVFTSYQAGNPDLFLLDYETRRLEALTHDALNITPCFSPDGKRIAFSRSVEGDPEIFVMTLKNRKLKRLTVSRGVDSSPTWAPNGREIAFTSDRHGRPQIYIMDADGSNVRRLSYAGDYCDAADWSPKGDLIAFQARIEGRFEICTVAPDGSMFTQWTSGQGANESPSWAPDGRHIVFSSTRDGGTHLFCLDIGSGNVIKITSGAGRFTNPAWSR
jgi:TolB protein